MVTLLVLKDEDKIKEEILKFLNQQGFEVSNPQLSSKIVELKADTAESLATELAKQFDGLENFFKEKKKVIYKSVLDIVEKSLIENILKKTEGNQLKAARLLGINRNTLRAKIKKLSIDATKWKIL